MEPMLDSLQSHRHELYDHFDVAQVAASADGREVAFMGPIATGVEIGGFAVIEFTGARRVVVQVREVRMVEREGPQLDFAVREQMTEMGVVSARARPLMRALTGARPPWAGSTATSSSPGRRSSRSASTRCGRRPTTRWPRSPRD